MRQAVQAAAHNLRVDVVTAEVLRAFDREAVASVLLKGPSTVRWLYAGRPRPYSDCDLLVAPQAIGAAERALAGLGFTPSVEQSRMPAWWGEHAIEWVHADRFAAVDLHHSVHRVGVGDALVWEVLQAETETMIVGGFPAAVLNVPGRALLLGLHSSNEDIITKDDLARAIEHADARAWERAAELACDLEASSAFSIGLRLVPQGEALAVRLGLPDAVTVDSALRDALAPPQALTVERLASASGLRERLAIAWHKLFPPATFMRHWLPRARRGPLSLLIAYVRRLSWVARSAPGALRAWRRARRRVQGEPPARA